ncbi:MAG: glycine betaine/L-proline ABC transporter ATP-binding protein ProV [Pontibacterium sp.]
MSAKLKLKNVCKIFGDDIKESLKMLSNGASKQEILAKTGQNLGVINANFEINQGEIFVIMGLSGSGKSTLVRMLNRLIEPSSGEILLNGVDIAKLSTEELLEVRRNDISMVFQSFALMPHMTVLENVAFGLELSGTSKQTRDQRALEALSQVGLESYTSHYPDELSGGMQQRVGLARALANDPEVLLMDEAFSALDPLIRTEMQDELIKLQAEQTERTIVFISHDLDEAMRIGDRIAIMEGGRVVQVGTPDEILKNPADDYVEAFFRDVDVSNVLTAGDIATKQQVTIIERDNTGVRTAIKRLSDYDRDWGYVLGKDGKFSGIVTPESLQEQYDIEGTIHAALLSDVTSIKASTLLSDIIGLVAGTPYGVPVVDDNNTYLGTITRAHLLNTLDQESGVNNGE